MYSSSYIVYSQVLGWHVRHCKVPLQGAGAKVMEGSRDGNASLYYSEVRMHATIMHGLAITLTVRALDDYGGLSKVSPSGDQRCSS